MCGSEVKVLTFLFFLDDILKQTAYLSNRANLEHHPLSKYTSLPSPHPTQCFFYKNLSLNDKMFPVAVF